jgi:hypothetical protein
MALTDMSKECKHLRSTGSNEVFIPGTKRAQQIVDKGFKCEIGKYGPHLCGPKRCDPRKRDCFVERTDEDDNAEETPAEEPKDEAKPAEE